MATKQQIGKKLLAVISRLKTLPDTLKKEYMFFSGEFDSNQTTFEQESNYLEIGVRAKSDTVGMTLLFLLRLIVDENWELAIWAVEDRLDDDEDKRSWKDLSVDELIEIYKYQDAEYMVKGPIDRRITRELVGASGSEIIKKSAYQIDLWTLPRIRKGIRELYGL